MRALSLILAVCSILISPSIHAEYVTITGTCQFSERATPSLQGLTLLTLHTYLSRVGIPPDDPRQNVYTLEMYRGQSRLGRVIVKRYIYENRVRMTNGVVTFFTDGIARLPQGDYRGFYQDGTNYDSAVDCQLLPTFFK